MSLSCKSHKWFSVFFLTLGGAGLLAGCWYFPFCKDANKIPVKYLTLRLSLLKKNVLVYSKMVTFPLPLLKSRMDFSPVFNFKDLVGLLEVKLGAPMTGSSRRVNPQFCPHWAPSSFSTIAKNFLAWSWFLQRFLLMGIYSGLSYDSLSCLSGPGDSGIPSLTNLRRAVHFVVFQLLLDWS